MARWREYFEELLNVSREVSEDMVGSIQKVPSVRTLGVSPHFFETVAAVRGLKTRKAPGVDGVETEIIKSLNDVNLRIFHEHLERIWRRLEPMPEEWKFGYIVPLPKKGDLSVCKNWRGIMLLSVPGLCQNNSGKALQTL